MRQRREVLSNGPRFSGAINSTVKTATLRVPVLKNLPRELCTEISHGDIFPAILSEAWILIPYGLALRISREFVDLYCRDSMSNRV